MQPIEDCPKNVDTCLSRQLRAFISREDVIEYMPMYQLAELDQILSEWEWEHDAVVDQG